MRIPLGVAAFLSLASAALGAAGQQEASPQQPQGEQPAPAASGQGQPAQQGQQQQPPIPAAADEVVGKPVVSSEGRDVGEVVGVLVTGQGQVAALVVKQSGTLGVGGKNLAIPWDRFSIVGDELTLGMTEQEVSQLPGYKEK
jgi:sporulation protein YlmC with PRC-barrel domain